MSRTTPSKKLSAALPAFLPQIAVSDILQSFALTNDAVMSVWVEVDPARTQKGSARIE